MKRYFVGLMVVLSAMLAVPGADAQVMTASSKTSISADKPVIENIAHRGTGPGTVTINGHRYSEDTIPALLAGYNLGATGREYDLQVTSDNKLVISHDPRVDRMTNGRGAIRQHTLKWVKRWVTSTGARMPNLRAYLIASQNQGGVHQQELKPYGLSTDTLEQIVRLDNKYIGDPNRVLFTSSEVRVLCRMKKIDRLYPTGLISFDNRRFDLNEVSQYHVVVDGQQVPCVNTVNFHYLTLDKSYVDQAHRHDLRVTARSVNDKRTFDRVVRIGVDRIVNDHPGYIAALLRQYYGQRD